MPAITINDLPTSRALDGKALSSIHGASSGLWTVGWIQAFVPPTPSSILAGVNFYQVNTTINNTQNIFIEEMNNLFQTVEVRNSGATSTINAVVIGALNKNA